MARRKSQKRRNKKYQENNRQIKTKRAYKDTIFRMLYHDKENLLSLYNAVNGKDYKNPDELQIVTLENAIYMGMNKELMEHCKTLKEYAQYVAMVRKYVSQNNSLEEAVIKAVDECIEEGILKEFLVKNKAEVIKVSIYEYDKEFEEKKLRKAEYEAGVEAGEQKLLKNQIRKKLEKEKTIAQIADELEEEVTIIQQIIEEIKKEE